MAPVLPITVPSSPTDTSVMPEKVSDPHRLPCVETRSMALPDESAYAFSPRTVATEVPARCQKLKGRGGFDGSRNAIQCPSTRTATPPVASGRAITSLPVPIG